MFTDQRFPSEEAALLALRAQLIADLRDTLVAKGWTQVQAAKALGVSPSRISDLVRGTWQQFSLDMRITLAVRAGRQHPTPKLPERPIPRHQRRPLQFGLRGEHALEGVAVQRRVAAGAQGVAGRDGEEVEVVRGEQFGEAARGLGHAGELADALLGGDFPGAGGADEGDRGQV